MIWHWNWRGGDVLWAYHSLEPTTVHISFFYICRFCARWNRFCPLCQRQFLMSSIYSLCRWPLWFFSSTLADLGCLTCLLSFILITYTCPKSLSFLFLAVATMDSSFAIFFLMSSFFHLSSQLILSFVR